MSDYYKYMREFEKSVAGLSKAIGRNAPAAHDAEEAVSQVCNGS